MSNRTLRVNELIHRELSDILHKRYQVESIAVTITGVQVAPDLHDGKVFIAVTGDEHAAEEKLRWLRRNAHELRLELGRRIVLKHMPKLTFTMDTATDRGNRILEVLDQISREEAGRPRKTGEAE